MPCPDDNQLSAMLQGFLDDDELRDIEAHLDGCPRCMQLVVDLAGGGGADPGELHRVGRYEVLEPIGSGGQGLVFAAFDPELQRRVALKILRPDRHPEPARLQREARLLASLSHANVMPVFEVGPWGDGLYLVTELGQGSLRSWVDRRHPWREVVAMWLGVGAGLAAAHRAGLVHRDIKPDNVVLHPDGRPLLTDFGLASSAPSHETSGGTPLYLAPELFEGRAADARSDQYALCVGLYETLVGRPPLGATPPRGEGVPARVHAVVVRGLSADPRDRYEDVDAFCAALRAASEPRAWGWPAAGVAAAASLALGVALVGAPAPTPVDVPEPAFVAPVLPDLLAQCDEEADKIQLTPCPDDLCAGAQRGRVLMVTECYARLRECERFHEWFDHLAVIDPQAPVALWRATNTFCPPRADDHHGQLRHFIMLASAESARDRDAALDVGTRARAYAVGPHATPDDIEPLWNVQVNVVRMLHSWYRDEAVAREEGARATAAFARPLPSDVLP